MEPPDPVYSFKGDMGNVLCLLLVQTDDSQVLYVGTNEGYVHAWDLKIKRQLKKLSIGQKPCGSLIETPKGFVTFSKGDSLQFWTSDWQLHKTLSADYCGFAQMCVDEDNILVPESDGKLILLDFDGEIVQRLTVDEGRKLGEVMGVKFFKSNFIVVCYEIGVVMLRTKVGEILSEFDVKSTPICCDICDLTGSIVVGTSSKNIFKLTFKDNTLAVEKTTELTNAGVSGVSVRADGKLCVASCFDGKVRYFSMKTLKLLAVLDSRGSPNCVIFSRFSDAFSPSGMAFVGCSDGRVTMWDLYVNK